MKFSVLCLNPCRDRTVFEHENENTKTEKIGFGGKGLNQSIMLNRFGAPVTLFSLTGDSGYAAFLEENRINAVTVATASPLRTNTKIIGHNYEREINEIGTEVRTDEAKELLHEFRMSDCDIVSLCGSIPPGIDKAIYYHIIKDAKDSSKLTVLDASGDALRFGLEARPELIKPNLDELSELSGKKLTEIGEVIAVCREIFLLTGTEVICTLGSEGSVFVGHDGIFRAYAPHVEVRGFAGAGDCFLAAFLYAKYILSVQKHIGSDKTNGDLTEFSLAFATAAAAAKVSETGTDMPDPKTVFNSYNKIKIEKIDI